MTIPTRGHRPSNGLFLDHWLNGPVLLQLRDLFPQMDHFPFEVWGWRGNLLVHAQAELFLQPGQPFLAFGELQLHLSLSRELWKLLELVGEVSPEWQTLRSEHRHMLLVPPPSVELELELQLEPPLGSCVVERDLHRWAVGALMVLSAIVLFFLRTADLQAADGRAPGANELKVL